MGILFLWLILTTQGMTDYKCYRSILWLNGCPWHHDPTATPCEAPVWWVCYRLFPSP